MSNNIRIVAFSFFAVVLLLGAYCLVPLADESETEDSRYVVRDIEVQNTFGSYLQDLRESLKDGAEYSEGTGTYKLRSAGQYFGLDSNTSLEIYPEIGSYRIIGEEAPASSRVVDSRILYDDSGQIEDIQLCFNGSTELLSDYYDPIDNCIWFIPAILAWEVIAALLVTATVSVVVLVEEYGSEIDSAINNFKKDIENYFNNNKPKNDIEVKIVLPKLAIIYEDGNITGIFVDKTKYDIKKNNSYSKNRPTDDNYYIAIKWYGQLFVLPFTIDYTYACSIMKLGNNMDDDSNINRGGKVNVYTAYQSNAYKVAASFGGVPLLHQAHGNGPDYLPHYHVVDHQRSAHAFFSVWQ